MKLFDCDNINITKIHHIEKYERRDSSPVLREYGTNFFSHEFIFYISGENDTTVGGIKIHDCPNSIRYIPKGHLDGKYTVCPLTEYASCVDIYFDTTSPMPNHPLALYDNEKIKDKVLKLANIWHKKEVGFYADSMKIFYDIISVLQKEQHNHYMSDTQKAYMQKAYYYIIKHYTDSPFNYRELCAASGLEYAYFSELFKKAYHMPPVKLITKMRIDYAKELLISGRYSVSEIAEMSGFENVYYFSTVFKKLTGFSPSKYPMNI